MSANLTITDVDDDTLEAFEDTTGGATFQLRVTNTKDVAGDQIDCCILLDADDARLLIAYLVQVLECRDS